jgi:pimeloyl-ACP methyl ester carboxylesterase
LTSTGDPHSEFQVLNSEFREVCVASVRTDILEIEFEEGGPANGAPLILLHGWPDSPGGWREVARRLQDAGYRTIVPHLRGSTPTRFLSNDTPRLGAAVALAQDAIDLADALNLDRFALIGHDWGARAAYTLAALFPERVTAIAALSVAYQPRGIFKVPTFDQSRLFWYQWFMCADRGAEAVRADPIAFARAQWDSWSPAGWYDEAEFLDTSASFSGPDWVAITLNSYRSRWCDGEAWDPRYDALQQRLGEVEYLSTPTLMIQGLADSCVLPGQSEHQDSLFTSGYRRVVLEGIGHFPQREAPAQVANAILDHLKGRG